MRRCAKNVSLGSGPGPVRRRPLGSVADGIEGRPVAGLDEVGPVEGMEAGIACQHVELHETQRFAATLSELEILVVAPHLPLGPRVAHGPQAHEQRLGAGEHERASQTVHAVAVSHFTDTGITRRERLPHANTWGLRI